MELKEFAVFFLTFVVIAIASKQIARYYPWIGLPMITGFLITGMITGPYGLGLIPAGATEQLTFINEVSLAFIAFAAGTELYFSELRSRMKSIQWMTFGQLVVTFIVGSVGLYLLDDHLPFMQDLSWQVKVAASILAGTIFVARSPASAMAIIDELRAKGPFTQTALGVTVLKDVLVIILFAICFDVSIALINKIPFNFTFIVLLVLELGLAFLAGYLIGRLMKFIFSRPWSIMMKTLIVLLIGYGIYLLSHYTREYSQLWMDIDLYLEPLLIAIIASFYITNYTPYRPEFQKILHNVLPIVYVAFFTLTGASALLDVLAEVWLIALVIFFLRLLGMIAGSYLGGTMAREPAKFQHLGWMPYVTQAGVGVGLATIVSREFATWGPEFATILIAVIILNQVVGPPLFKYSINKVGEAHVKATPNIFDGSRDAIIFGYEPKSVALAQQLIKSGWTARIASRHASPEEINSASVTIEKTRDISLDTLHTLQIEEAEAVITMMDDDDNYTVCELVYEHFGIRHLVVRLNERVNFKKFHDLGALIVNPPTAIVSLLDHFVRSPQATSLLLGMEENQDALDLEVHNRNIIGLALRDLHLPADVLILSVSRGGQLLISHGFTRLRKGDIVTMVGSVQSLNNIRHRFEGIKKTGDILKNR